MASYSRDAKEWAVLEEVTAANMNKAPGGWIGFALNSSNQTGITGTAQDITDATVTCNVHTNRLLLVMCQAHVTSTTAGSFSGEIVEGGTTIGRWGRGSTMATNDVEQHSGWALRNAASNGSHTFKMQLSVQSTPAGGVFTVSGGSPAEAKILVLDIGPGY